MSNSVISRWHTTIDGGNPDALNDILADDVVFHSPVVHSPQRGKAITSLYLGAAFSVLANDSFTYVRQVIGEHDAVLEFTTEIDGIIINGVDMMRWNDDGKIVDFKVMVRPLKAIELLHRLMGEMLATMR